MSRFKKPTFEELLAYSKEIQFYAFDAERFIDHYEMVGWVTGKSRTPMKNWQAAVRTWKRNALEWKINQQAEPPRETSYDKKRRLAELDDRYMKTYAEQIQCCRDWYGKEELCPMGDPHEAESLLLAKIQDNHGHAFVKALLKRLPNKRCSS